MSDFIMNSFVADPNLIASIDRAVMDRDGSALGADEIRFRCVAPGHPDRHPSARWNRKKGVWVCDTCGTGGGAIELADLLGIDRPAGPGGRGDVHPPKITCNRATAPTGCTLAQFAEAKKLPVDLLKALGWSDVIYQGIPAVRIPYRMRDGRESSAVRFRLQMEKSKPDMRFVWRKGSKPHLYGLDQIDGYHKSHVLAFEGESDTVTGLSHGLQVLGLPGAGNWKDARDAEHLEKFERIYVVIEPDAGGEAVKKWVANSSIRDRVSFISLAPYKDISEAHVAGADVGALLAEAIEQAVPWAEQAADEADQIRDEAWALAEHLLLDRRLLDLAVTTVKKRGVVGMDRNIALYYLIFTSRVLDRPISAAIKGPSSAGKSYAVDEVLRLMPTSAYLTMTGMSEKALIYTEESLVHRHLLIYEATGLSSDFGSYLIRTLLSEGKLVYSSVEKTPDGLRPKTMVREGPTGFITTTTSASLHPENETRMLSIPVADDRDQTQAIFRALADPQDVEIDYEPWHAVQTWIDHAEHRVVIPFAKALAEEVPPLAVRQRRDFGQVLAFIRTHAILYQAQRQKDAEGRIIATLEDYEAVRGLIHDLMSAGIGATVPATVRETVGAVTDLAKVHDGPQSITDIAKHLKLDKSAALRRVRVAIADGYLVNQEEKRGRPAKIVIGDPLPEDIDILPAREKLEDGCRVAGDFGGIDHPSPPPGDNPEGEASGGFEPKIHDGVGVW